MSAQDWLDAQVPPPPTVGRAVHYLGDDGTQAAVITAVGKGQRSRNPERDVPDCSTPTHVHLKVFPAGTESVYTVHNVPFSPCEDQLPGSWRWPPRA